MKRRAIKDLRFISQNAPDFEPLRLKQRATDCVYYMHDTHDAWNEDNFDESKDWMTNRCWQNEQLVHVDRWEEGVRNVRNIKDIREIAPILFVHKNDGAPHERSMVVMSIGVNMQDYWVRRDTNEIVEGSKIFKTRFNHIVKIHVLWAWSQFNGSAS